MANRRHNRVAAQIQSEIAGLILRDIADPQVQGISITEVELTGDLKNATVYYHPGFGGNLKEIEKGIARALPFFRRSLARALSMRQVPELRFEVDTHTEKLNHILGLLDEVSAGKPAGEVG